MREKETSSIHKELQQITHLKIMAAILYPWVKKDYCGSLVGQLAVIAVEPAGKTSFV